MINMGQIRREYERAQEKLANAKSGKTQEYWQGRVAAISEALSFLKREEKSFSDLEYDLSKAMSVLRIFRNFLSVSPETMKPEDSFFTDPDESTGEGLYKIINDTLLAYDAFITKYEQKDTTVKMAEVTP
jgi:hypothetical protein